MAWEFACSAKYTAYMWYMFAEVLEIMLPAHWRCVVILSAHHTRSYNCHIHAGNAPARACAGLMCLRFHGRGCWLHALWSTTLPRLL